MKNTLKLRACWERTFGFLRASRGFTLIETFVAITLLVAAVVGPLSIASSGLQAAMVGEDQVTASYLAQDSIEYIRYVRDTNRLAGNAWTNYLGNCISTDGSQSCFFDSTVGPDVSGNISACGSGGACPLMMYDTSTGFYNYNAASQTNSATRFIRIVKILSPVCTGALCNSNELAVTATVMWETGTASHTFSVRENLFAWQ